MKYFIHLLLLTFLSGNLFADFVSINDARKVAKNVYFERLSQFEECSLEKIKFKSEFGVKDQSNTLYYVFNVENNNGYVLIAADNQSYPVLGYTFEGELSQNSELNPALAGLIEGYKKEIIEIINKDLPADEESTEAWNRYLSEDFQTSKSVTTLGPLVETKWNQSPYYNALCPGNSVTGCVSTAMSQIMRYYKHPKKGTGSHSYYHSSYGNLSADFGATTYNYSNMPNQVNSPNNDVATLCYHTGVSVEMNYSPSGSGASTQMSVSSFKQFFGYSNTAIYEKKSSFSDIDWKIKLRAEHMNGRPVIYTGRGSYGGHAWIIDGFQYPDHFHCNWGWGGMDDGYFYLTNLNTSSYDLNNDQGGIFDLYPDPSYSTITSLEDNTKKVIAVYPNPTSENISISFDEFMNEEAKIFIYDMSGRMLKVMKKTISGYELNIALPELNSGQYQLMIDGETLNFVEPIIIK